MTFRQLQWLGIIAAAVSGVINLAIVLYALKYAGLI